MIGWRDAARVPLLMVLLCLASPPFATASEKIAMEHLVQNLILNRFENRQERVALLEHLAGPQMREQIKGLSLEIEDVIRALYIREFNRDMIAELKQKGWVGEARQGFVEIPPSAYSAIPEQDAKLVRDVLKEENRSRELIMKLLAAFPAKERKPGEMAPLRRHFAAVLRQQVQPGEWIQEEDGSWVRK